METEEGLHRLAAAAIISIPRADVGMLPDEMTTLREFDARFDELMGKAREEAGGGEVNPGVENKIVQSLFDDIPGSEGALFKWTEIMETLKTHTE